MLRSVIISRSFATVLCVGMPFAIPPLCSVWKVCSQSRHCALRGNAVPNPATVLRVKMPFPFLLLRSISECRSLSHGLLPLFRLGHAEPPVNAAVAIRPHPPGLCVISQAVWARVGALLREREEDRPRRVKEKTSTRNSSLEICFFTDAPSSPQQQHGRLPRRHSAQADGSNGGGE